MLKFRMLSSISISLLVALPLPSLLAESISRAVVVEADRLNGLSPVELTNEDGTLRVLTLDEVVRLVMANNSYLRIQQLELLKADSEARRNNSRYAPVVGLGYEGYKSRDKNQPSSMFQGTKMHQDTYSASLSKLFSTGTYFEIEASDNRFDSNAGEGIQYQGTLFSQLAQPPLHTGALRLTLRQELLKNSFGYSFRRMNEIARNNSEIMRQQLEYDLSGLVVRTMIDYWSLAIAEEGVETSQLLLNSTRNIRGITRQKLGVGLSENFELNQWNALVSGAEAQLEVSILERDNKRRELLRMLNLDPELELVGATELVIVSPSDLDVDRDIAHALASRPDLRNIELQRHNARLGMEIANDQLKPSVSIGGFYSSRDYGRHARTAWNEVPHGTYPEMGVQFRFEYPLWDEGAKVDARNARISLQQLDLQKQQIEREVIDEIRSGAQQIETAWLVLEKSEQAVLQTQAFYNGIVTRYRQGRFTAEAIKEALDALVRSRQQLMQARINYNIALVRYDMARNQIFSRFDIDVDEVLRRLEQ